MKAYLRILVSLSIMIFSQGLMAQINKDLLEQRVKDIQEYKNAQNGIKAPSSGLMVDANKTAIELVEELLGEGFIMGDNVFNVQLIGAASSNGFFNGSASNIGMNNGVIFSSGNALSAEGPNSNGSTSGDLGNSGDPDLDMLPGIMGTHDASGISFDFVPGSDTIRLQYVFASEEYCQYVDSFNDVFAIFLTSNEDDGYNYSNTNMAVIPDTDLPVSINTLNHGSIGDQIDPNICDYCEFYVDNQPDGNGAGSSVEYDGFTTLLSAKAVVSPNKEYQIKIVIADNMDGVLDSGIFLNANSFTSVSCYPYDLDCDGDVDILDISAVAYCYGTSVGEEAYNPAYDMDSDGDIDILDVTAIAYEYGWNAQGI